MYTLNVIDDLGKGFEDVIKVLGNVLNFVWDLIKTIADTITMIIESIYDIFEWITSYFSILPTEILALFNFTIIILVALLIYRFVR